MQQPEPEGPYLWPDLAEALVAEGGILQMLFAPTSPQPAGGGGGFDLRRVLSGVWISNYFGGSPPLSLRPSLDRVLTSQAAARAVNTFLDAAAAAYEDVIKCCTPIIRPSDTDANILESALCACD